MSRIDDIFTRLRAAGRGALMPFVTGGHPSIETLREILPRLERAGADIVEIGIPFSDPIADGPVIAASMHEALERGATPRAVFDAVRDRRAAVEIGLIAMVSESIIDRIGVARFVCEAVESGFDGLIVPDADTQGGHQSPGGAIAQQAVEHGLTCSFLIAPTTSESRLAELASISSGFIYLLARVGITGERDESPEIAQRVEVVRRHTDLPVAVGFGISRGEHVQAVLEHADAAIVGSALVRRMAEADDPVAAAESYVRELSESRDQCARGRGGAHVRKTA